MHVHTHIYVHALSAIRLREAEKWHRFAKRKICSTINNTQRANKREILRNGLRLVVLALCWHYSCGHFELVKRDPALSVQQQPLHV